MESLIEQLKRQNALLFLGREAVKEDRFAAACRELARLPFRRVVILGEAPHLLAAWQRAGRTLDVVSLGGAPPRLDESRVTWLTLPANRDAEPAWLAPLLRTWFAVHTVCLLGCDLEDEGFRQRYLEVAHALGPHRHAYQAIVPHPPAEGDRHYWSEHNMRLAVADPMDWAGRLADAWSQASQVESGAEVSAGRPAGRPYRFLDPYTEAEAGCFFGRAAAIRDLGELVLAERLVLCFGPSGAGKTSLLRAGLVPRLRRQGCLPLYSRPGSDPVHEIRQAAFSLLHGDGGGPEDPLAELLAGLAQQAGRTVVVLLDQFEETFALLGRETATRLATDLAGCLRLPGGEVHIVLSLREDYLAHLHRLQPHLAGIYAHRFRLRPLAREQAREAIEAPAHLFGLSYEPELTEQLLRDLHRDDDHVAPSDLQIVCHALYEDLQTRKASTFTLARYGELGGVTQLLGGYLERVVMADPAPDRVRATLKVMVTAAGTRTLLPSTEIARLAGMAEQATVEILQRLDRPHRLVRPLRQEGAVNYELAHEVLGPRILAWIEDPAEREAKATHDLLRAELHNWRTLGVLPNPGKLRAIHAQRDNAYLRLGPGEVELMARGAIWHDVEPAFWRARAEAAGVPGGAFLLPALAVPRAEVRRQAVHLLGPEQALAELSRLLHHTEAGVRAQTATTLGEMEGTEARRLLRRARHDPAKVVRDTVWEALEAQAPSAAERLRFRDEMAPLLAAGSLVYWLLLVLAWRDRFTPEAWPAWALAGGLWLAALLGLSRLAPSLTAQLGLGHLAPSLIAQRGLVGPSLPGVLLYWTYSAVTAGLLIAAWGWLKGGAVFLLLWWLGGDLRDKKPYLALAVFLPYLPLLGLVDATTAHVLWSTGGLLLALSLLALVVPRWGRYGTDRPAALAFLGAGLGAVAGGLLTGSEGAALLLGTALAAGREWTRRLLVSTEGEEILPDSLVGFYRLVWEGLDEISFKLKPFLGVLLGGVWAALLLWAAAGLPPGTAPAWNIGDTLLLGAGLGLGLWWAEGGLLRALLLPTLGGAAGGALAQGVDGALVGAGIGLGLGFGEWLATRATTARDESSLETEE